MAVNFYTVKKEINGVVYTAQFNGMSAALKAVDSSYIDGTNTVSSYKISQYLLENVIVDPKVTIDDFACAEDLNEVTQFAQEVMQGNFREEAKQEGTTAKGTR